jgi:hypothetical protein
MDHSVIIDLNNGTQDVWFNIKKPADMNDGSIITLMPVPAQSAAITINEIEGSQVPNPSLADKVSYQAGVRVVLSSLKDWIIIPFAILVLLLLVLYIVLFIKRNDGTGQPGTKKALLRVSIALIPVIIIVGFSVLEMTTLGVGGGSLGGYGAPLIPNENDQVTIVHQEVTKNGTTLQVIEAQNGTGLADYLERNGLPKSPTNNTVLSRYVSEGYNFAITQTPSTALSENQKRYIHVTFPSERLFFPLGVNYQDSEMMHGVDVMVLKPVVIAGFAPDFSTYGPTHGGDHVEQMAFNKTISYYKDPQGGDFRNPYTHVGISIVHFFDSVKNYAYDVTMDIGIPQSVKTWAVIFHPAVLFLLIFVLFIVFVSIVTAVLSKLPRLLQTIITVLITLLTILTIGIMFLTLA